MDIPAGDAAGRYDRKFHAALAQGLIAYAEWAFRRGRKTSDGATEQDHGDAAARILKKLGKTVPMPKPKAPPPPYPARLDYLWRDFIDIIRGMDGGGFSPPVVTWSGLQSWSQMTGTRLDPWEMRLIVELGTVRANILAEKTSSGGQDEDRTSR